MKITIMISSAVLFILCAVFISGSIRNFNGLFSLIFMPDKFIRMSVDNAVIEEDKTDKGFTEQFNKNKVFHEATVMGFNQQFVDATGKLRKSIFESFRCVFLITVVSFILTLFLKRYLLIDSKQLFLIQILSSFLILWALLGQLGWSIQTLVGTTLPEQVNNYWFRFLNCLGIGMFFFSCFYQTLKIKLKAQSTEEPNLSLEQVQDRLDNSPEDVVSEIYEITYKQLSDEDTRRCNLDSKANNLAGMIGVYLSILFGLNGMGMTNLLFNTESEISFFLYIVSCLFAAGALVFALGAARARSDLRKINDLDVFNSEATADTLSYKKYMAAHYWVIYKNNHTISENKGLLLKFAYRFFFIAVILLTVLTVKNTYYYKIQKDRAVISKTQVLTGDQTKCLKNQ